MYIEIVTTPNDALKETGFGSQLACHGVMKSLQGSNHNAVVSVCLNAADLAAVIKRKPDLIMAVVKYILLENGEELWLSDYFSSHGVNFTGSSKDTLDYDSNKVSAKHKVASKGIKTAEFFITEPHQHATEKEIPLPFPLFIKPTDAANGNGVDTDSLVYDFSHFQSKVKSLYKEYEQPILVEKYLDGREFTVAVIEDNEKLIIAAVELVAPEEGGIRILGAKVKTGNTEVMQVIEDAATLAKVSHIAEKSFRALGVRDFGRIDIKMDHHGVCHFIEANLVPGMKKGSSYFPQACGMSANLDYDEVVRMMIQGATGRMN